MFCHKCKCCMPTWWSGFFALALVGHLLRLLFRAQVHIGQWAVPMRVSIGVVIVAGALSLILCKKGCASCTCASTTNTGQRS